MKAPDFPPVRRRPFAAMQALQRSTRSLVRSFRETLELATLLAFIAGIVNSAAFMEFGTFVSHISGHATRAAVEFTKGLRLSAYIFLLETLAFILGAFVTAILLRGHTAASKEVKYTGPVLVEAGLLLSFLFLNSTHAIGFLRWGDMSLSTLLLAFAMGMQNALLRQSSGAILRTTHMTGVATDLGFELGAAVRAALTYLRQSHQLRSTLRCFLEVLGVGRFTFHLSLFFAFSSGAVLGTYAFLHVGRFTLMLPALLLTLIGLREYLRPVPQPSSNPNEP